MTKLKYATITVLILLLSSIFFVACGKTASVTAKNEERVVAIEAPKPLIKEEEMSDREYRLSIAVMVMSIASFGLGFLLVDEIQANSIEKRAWENKIKRYEKLLKEYSEK